MLFIDFTDSFTLIKDQINNLLLSTSCLNNSLYFQGSEDLSCYIQFLSPYFEYISFYNIERDVIKLTKETTDFIPIDKMVINFDKQMEILCQKILQNTQKDIVCLIPSLVLTTQLNLIIESPSNCALEFYHTLITIRNNAKINNQNINFSFIVSSSTGDNEFDKENFDAWLQILNAYAQSKIINTDDDDDFNIFDILNLNISWPCSIKFKLLPSLSLTNSTSNIFPNISLQMKASEVVNNYQFINKENIKCKRIIPTANTIEIYTMVNIPSSIILNSFQHLLSEHCFACVQSNNSSSFIHDLYSISANYGMSSFLGKVTTNESNCNALTLLLVPSPDGLFSSYIILPSYIMSGPLTFISQSVNNLNIKDNSFFSPWIKNKRKDKDEMEEESEEARGDIEDEEERSRINLMQNLKQLPIYKFSQNNKIDEEMKDFESNRIIFANNMACRLMDSPTDILRECVSPYTQKENLGKIEGDKQNSAAKRLYQTPQTSKPRLQQLLSSSSREVKINIPNSSKSSKQKNSSDVIQEVLKSMLPQAILKDSSKFQKFYQSVKLLCELDQGLTCLSLDEMREKATSHLKMKTFDLESSEPIAAIVTSHAKRSSRSDMVSWERERVASFLLSEKHYIAALELHQDLLETNGESIPELEAFFNDIDNLNTICTDDPDAVNEDADPLSTVPGLLHIPSPFKPGSELDAVAYRDEKLVLLEYDLRCAQVDLRQLRETTSGQKSLSPSSSVETSLSSLAVNTGLYQGSEGNASANSVLVDNKDISENERAILNVLVSSYLKDFGYKISAITFIEEIGSKQDLSNIESLNMHLNNRSKLLQLYRNRTAPVAEKIDLENELNEVQKKLNAAKNRIKILEEEVDSLTGAVAAAKNTPSFRDAMIKSASFGGVDNKTPTASSSSNSLMPPIILAPLKTLSMNDISGVVNDNFTKGGGGSKSNRTTPDLSESMVGDLISNKNNNLLVENDKRRYSSNSIVQSVLDDTYSEDGGGSYDGGDNFNIFNLENNVQVIKVLANALPSLISNVALQGRHELIPLISIVVKDHPDHVVRERLVGTLINLTKKPNHTQRQLILDALYTVSSVGPDRVEHELLPALISSFKGKYKEQKILIAQGIGLFAGNVRVGFRHKLFSKLYGLIQDESSEVRRAVMTSALAIIKILPVQDESAEVIIGYVLSTVGDKAIPSNIQSEFLPLAIKLIDDLKLLWSNVLPQIVKLLIAVISEPSSTESSDFTASGSKKISSNEILISKGIQSLSMSGIGPLKLDSNATDAVFTLLTNISFILPVIYECMLRNAPISVFPYTQNATILLNDILMGRVPDSTNNNLKWDGLNCVILTLTLSLVGIAPLFDTASADGKRLKQILAQTIHGIGVLFGPAYVGRITYPLFLHLMGMAGKVTDAVATTDDISSKPIPNFSILSKMLSPVAYLPVLTQFPLEPASAAPTDMKLAERVLPTFAGGVLIDLDAEETQDFLKRSLIAVATESKGWTSRQFPLIEEIFVLLCKHGNNEDDNLIRGSNEMISISKENVENKNNNICNTALNVLQSLSVSSKNKIRIRVVKLLGELIHVSSTNVVETRVVPLIMTLSNDSAIEVRTGIVRALTQCFQGDFNPENKILESIKKQFNKLAQDSDHSIVMEVLRAFVRIMSVCVPSLREGLILETLEELAKKIVKNEVRWDHSKLEEIAIALLNAIQAYCSCSLNKSISARLIVVTNLLLSQEDLLDENFHNLAENMLLVTLTAV